MPVTPEQVLKEMLMTRRSKAAEYSGDTADKAGAIMAIIFPKGVYLSTPEEFECFSIFNQMIGKFIRFGATRMSHVDSVHDLGVYSAMLEATIRTNMENNWEGML